MPYPNKSASAYDYVSYQVSEPTHPLPAPSLAADLAHLKAANDDAIDFLKKFMRSDGKVKTTALPQALDFTAVLAPKWFLTRDAFAATECPPDLQMAMVIGLETIGDLGKGAFFKRVASQPTYLTGWFRSADRYLPDGSVSSTNGGYWQYEPTDDVFNIGHLGAISDASASDATAEINRKACWTATSMAADRGRGGVVHVPGGHFISAGSTPGAQVFFLTDGVSLRGVGRGVSKVEAKAGSDQHMINMSGSDRITVSGLTFEHNGGTHTAGVHCIRVGDLGGEMLIFRDLELLNPHHYGFGFGGTGSGNNIFIAIDNVRIYRPGADGIDNKDRAGSDLAFYLHKVTVEEPGYRQVVGGADNSAGVDLRGIVMVSDCNVLNIKAQSGNDVSGFRVRSPNALVPTHLGGMRSQMVNCYVSGVTSGGRSIGFNVVDGEVGLANCHAEGMWRPFQFSGADAKAVNIAGKNFTEIGVAFMATASGTRVTQATMNTNAVGATIGFAAGTGATDIRLSSIKADGPATGIVMASGSSGRIEDKPDFVNNATAAISDASAGGWRIGFDALAGSADSVASASTVNLRHCGAVTTITGTNQISAFTLSEGCWRQLQFAGILRIVNSASLILPGGTDIITAAGDSMMVICEPAGVVRCVDWRPADAGKVQTANVASGSAVSLTTSTSANVASVALDVPGTYEISGQVAFQGGASVNVTDLAGWLNSTSATMPDGTALAAPMARPLVPAAGVVPGSNPFVVAVPPGIITVGTTPVTLYLGARSTFTVGTMAAYGVLYARRVR